jgi:tRNA nucleotidyltransferase (CCA-adding enzyme)
MAATQKRSIGSAAEVLARLEGVPGGAELLALARRREDVALVGGAVRDLLCDAHPRELDVSVSPGASSGFARALAETLEGQVRPFGETLEPKLHERFGTASITWPHGRIDIAERRAETYAEPGALPDLRPATLAEDLERRDFTINAIAIPLGGARAGELVAVAHALEDLRDGLLRVLHPASFRDDPTRLLRLARYRARLALQIEPGTLELALRALDGGALATVSGSRIASELWLLTEERHPGGMVALGELGVLEALGLPAHFDQQLLEQAAELLPGDGVYEALQMAVLFHPPGGLGPPGIESARALMESFEFVSEVRQRLLGAAFGVDAVAAEIEQDTPPSQLRSLLGSRGPEAVAIIGALAARRSPQARGAVERWLGELRHVQLEIDGADLLAAGVPEGPEVGARLARALELRLDGRLAPGRQAELSAALQESP